MIATVWDYLAKACLGATLLVPPHEARTPWPCSSRLASLPQWSCRAVRRAAIVATVLLAGGAVLPVAGAEQPCGPDAPCAVSDGEYHLAFPKGWDGSSPLPAMLFFHGHGSNGRNVVRNGGLAKTLGKAGYLLVAPTGSNWPGHKATGWPARLDAPARRDDIALASQVMDDVARRVPLAADKVLVSGFSSGGSLAWHIACHGDGRFAAYASVAGGLRRPVPESTCPAGAFRLLHIHGFADKQVPLEGRAIRDWHQGDVFESLSIARAGNECRSKPARFTSRDRYQCRVWDKCGSGHELGFCLHDGGHGLPRGWLGLALQWFEGDS